MKTALIVIDVRNDFYSGAALELTGVIKLLG
jgi:nicotinamidase-related amidase